MFVTYAKPSALLSPQYETFLKNYVIYLSNNINDFLKKIKYTFKISLPKLDPTRKFWWRDEVQRTQNTIRIFELNTKTWFPSKNEKNLVQYILRPMHTYFLWELHCFFFLVYLVYVLQIIMVCLIVSNFASSHYHFIEFCLSGKHKVKAHNLPSKSIICVTMNIFADWMLVNHAEIPFVYKTSL